MLPFRRLLVLVCLIDCYTAFGQEPSQSSTALRDGTWALQFQVASNFTLASFQGATISGKYHFSSKDAIRVGVTLSGNTSSNDETLGSFAGDTSIGTGSSNTDRNGYLVAVTSQYIVYPDLGGVVRPFVGAGPLLSYQHSKNESENITSAPGSVSLRRTSSLTGNSWGVGISGVIGVEWFFAQSFSLLGEYGLSIQYQKGNGSSRYEEWYSGAAAPDRKTIGESHLKGWSLTSNNVRFGLTVYL